MPAEKSQIINTAWALLGLLAVRLVVSKTMPRLWKRAKFHSYWLSECPPNFGKISDCIKLFCIVKHNLENMISFDG